MDRTTRRRAILHIDGLRMVYARIRDENMNLDEQVENVTANINDISMEGDLFF